MSSSRSRAGESAHEDPLPGFIFHPTPEVAVSYYLKMKIQGRDSKFKHSILEIDLRKIEPWDIPAFLGEPDVPDDEKEWWFFTRPYYKYNHGTRFNRTTDRGYYKMQGKERDIWARQSTDLVGKKKNFTFYRGRPGNAEKDDWFLDEYSLAGTEKGRNTDMPDFVICCLTKQQGTSKKPKDDQAVDMNLDPVEHLAPREEGDVLNGNGNHDECYESPNGSCLSNDDLTCDDEIDGSIFSGLDFQAALDEKFEEYSALIKRDMDLQPSDPRQSYKLPHPPQPQPHNFQNGAADERIAEASFQPEDNLALYFPESTGFHYHQ